MNGTESEHYNGTDDTVNDHYFAMDFTVVSEEIWVVVSAIVGVLANGLLIYCLIKLSVRCATYIALFNLAILDIIQLLTCPPMYKVISKSNDILEEFEAHSIFTNAFFCSMYGTVLIYLLIVVKMHVKAIEKAFLYILIGIWIVLLATFVGGYLGYQVYYHRAIFVEIYFIMFLTLFIATLIDQIISTVNLEREKPTDHKTWMVLILMFITIRMCLPLIFITISLVTMFTRNKLGLNIITGLIQYNAVLNVYVLALLDVKIKGVLCSALRKSPVSTNNVNFVNLQEETVNILNDE